MLAAALVHLTREAGSGVDPLEQLSYAQFLSVVAVTRHHDLTHFHLRLADSLFVVLFFIFFLLFHIRQHGGTHPQSCGSRSSFQVNGNLTVFLAGMRSSLQQNPECPSDSLCRRATTWKTTSSPATPYAWLEGWKARCEWFGSDESKAQNSIQSKTGALRLRINSSCLVISSFRWLTLDVESTVWAVSCLLA